MIRIIIFAPLMWSVSIYAIVRGDFSERVVSVSLREGAGLVQLAAWSDAVRLQHAEIGVLLIGMAIFAVLFAAALFSGKFWSRWITAVQDVGILGHFSPFLPAPSRAGSFDARLIQMRPGCGSRTTILTGDPAPHPRALRIAQAVAEAANWFGIAVHDHIIIGRRGRASSRRLGGTV